MIYETTGFTRFKTDKKRISESFIEIITRATNFLTKKRKIVTL